MNKQRYRLVGNFCVSLLIVGVTVLTVSNKAFKAQLVAASQTVTINPKNMIGIMYNIGTSRPPEVYSVGDPADPYDDVSNRRIGWGALSGGWAGLIAQFEADMAKGIKFIELDAPFGRWGWYLTEAGEPQCKTTTASGVRCKGKVEKYQISGWNELNTIYQTWLGQVPPIITTWPEGAAFNQRRRANYPDVTVQVHTGSPHNDYELNKLVTELTSQGVSQPLMDQRYWDMLWSFYKPYFDVGFRTIVLDNSAGDFANHLATKRALEVLRDASLRDCNGLDRGLCGSLGSTEPVQVRVEAVPRETYQYPFDYWVRNDVSYRPGQQCPNERCTGMATRFIRFGDETAESLLQQVHAVLSDGYIALLSSGDRTTLGFTTMDELVSRLNVSIPVRIDLSSGNPNGSGLTYQIVTPPRHGTLTQNPNYPSFFKYTPTLPLAASDSFTYTIASSNGVSSPGTVNIQIVGGSAVSEVSQPATSAQSAAAMSQPRTVSSAAVSSLISVQFSSKRQRQIVQQVIDDRTTKPPVLAEPSSASSVPTASVASSTVAPPPPRPSVRATEPEAAQAQASSFWPALAAMPLLAFTLVLLCSLLLLPPPTMYALGMIIRAAVAGAQLTLSAAPYPWLLHLQPFVPYLSAPVAGLMRVAPPQFEALPFGVKFIFVHTVVYGTVIGILANSRVRNSFPWLLLGFAVLLSFWDTPLIVWLRNFV